MERDKNYACFQIDHSRIDFKCAASARHDVKIFTLDKINAVEQTKDRFEIHKKLNFDEFPKPSLGGSRQRR
jgi:hypothetical protein